MSKKNAKQVSFLSGQKAGREEVLRAVANAIIDERWHNKMRTCCVGHYEDDFMAAVRSRLKELP